MPENDRGIGSEGLEQGGPNLGNDYSRPVGTRGNTDARDAVIVPHDKDRANSVDNTLNMDTESSRNLSGEDSDFDSDLEDDTEEDDDDMMEDDELQDMDPDDDDDDDDENDII